MLGNRRRFSRVVAILVLMALPVAGLTGCGGSQATSQGQPRSALPDKVVIGALIPQTGQGASYGVLDKNGADLAVEQVNASGGIKGKIKIEIKYEDHQAKPDVAVSAFRSLIERFHTPYVISSYSSPTMAVAPIADQEKVVVVNGGGQSDNLAGAAKYLFSDIPLVGLETHAIAKYLATEGGAKTASIIYANDEGGRSSKEAFTKAFEANGGKVLGAESSELGAADFRSQLAKIKAQNPDILFLSTYGKDTATIIKQAGELQIHATITDTSWSLIPEVLALPEAEGMIHTKLAIKPTGEFTTAYTSKYGQDPSSSVYPVTFYDGVMIFKAAAEYAIDHDYGLTGEGIRKAISEIRRFQGGAGTVQFLDDGTSVRPVEIDKLHNAKSELIKTVGAD